MQGSAQLDRIGGSESDRWIGSESGKNFKCADPCHHELFLADLLLYSIVLNNININLTISTVKREAKLTS